METRIKATNVFKRTHDALFKHRFNGVMSEGGSRSSKTKSNCQLIAKYCLENTGKIGTLGRDWRTNFKKTVWLDMQWALRSFGADFKLNNTELTIEVNGNLLRCIGTNDDPMLTYGLEQDFFWLNEANNIPKDAFDQLEQRTKEFWMLDYNPKDSDHWIYDLEARPDVALVKSTMLDNPFIPENSRRKILSYDPSNEINVQQKTADEYKWKVFGLGERGASDDVIFKKVFIYNDNEEPAIDDCDLYCFGGDFGYSSPSAYVQIKKVGINLYLRTRLYETGLTNKEIAEKTSLWKQEVSVWDSAEAKSIRDLRLAGVNAIKSIKGDGSVYYGLQKLLNYNIFVHNESNEMIKEFRTAKWETDESGHLLKDRKGRPIHKNTTDFHNLAATRYGFTRFVGLD
jgi:phage terminase large subunit